MQLTLEVQKAHFGALKVIGVLIDNDAKRVVEVFRAENLRLLKSLVKEYGYTFTNVDDKRNKRD